MGPGRRVDGEARKSRQTGLDSTPDSRNEICLECLPPTPPLFSQECANHWIY
jgi:hypothetical protein